MANWQYKICGLRLASNRPLELLLPDPEGAPEIVLDWNSSGATPEPADWFRSWDLPNGATWLRMARIDGGYFLRFDGKADFWISPAADHVVCRQFPGIPEYTADHLLLDQALPLLLSRRGMAVFHGSAVEVGGAAIAFSGASGRGKSTLAAWFTRNGGRLLTDDCLTLRRTATGHEVLPSYPGLRLWSDSFARFAAEGDGQLVSHYKDKRRVACEPAEAVPLRRFFFLEVATGPDLEIERISGAALLRDIVGSQFLLDSQDPKELQSGFTLATELAQGGVCYRLAVPRGLDQLPEWAERITEHADLGRP